VAVDALPAGRTLLDLDLVARALLEEDPAGRDPLYRIVFWDLGRLELVAPLGLDCLYFDESFGLDCLYLDDPLDDNAPLE